MENLFNSHYAYLRKVALNNLPKSNRDFAEDMVQDAFYKASKNFDKFDTNAGKLITWMATIVQNNCRDFLRKKVNQEVKFDDFSQFEGLHEELNDEKTFNIRHYLGSLSDNEQRVIRMRYFLNMSAKEMAPILGVKPGNIPMMHKRAIQKLKALLEDDGIQSPMAA